MQRLRTVTSLDVSAVAGHHAMPAALLLNIVMIRVFVLLFYSVDVTAVACGKDHVVVVGSEGEVFAWGSGADGKLGLGNEENQ